MAPRGRPTLTPADYEERLQAYCRRYGVSPTAAGTPPFPSGRRETAQHREWLALYKAHARLRPQPAPAAPHGSCAVCGRPVDSAGGRSHAEGMLHAECDAIVTAVRPLGPAGLDRLRAFLWPAGPRKASGRARKPRE